MAVGTTGKAVLRHLIDRAPEERPGNLSEALDSVGISPSPAEDLRATCEAAIAAVPDAAEKVRRGKIQAAAPIVGEVMKLSQGRADAKRSREIILEILTS